MSKKHQKTHHVESETKQHHEVVIRFVGRFVFATSPNADEVYVTAANMQYNDVISDCAHRTLLTAPLEAFEIGEQTGLPSRRPDDRVVTGHFHKTPKPVATLIGKPVEYAVWELAGLHLDLPDVGGGTTWANQDLLPDVTSRANSKFDVRCVQSAKTCSPVAMSMTINGGHFTAVPGGQAITWGVFGGSSTPTGKAEPTALCVDLKIRVKHVLWLVIRHRIDGTGSAIALDAATAAAGVPIVISNVCAGRVRPGGPDPEFAAYYDMLEAPPVVIKRQVPYVVQNKSMGAECYFSSQAGY